MLSLLRSLYRRLGPRYPSGVLIGMLPTAYLTALIGVAGTALYIDMSAGEFLRLFLAASLLLWTIDIAFETRLIR